MRLSLLQRSGIKRCKPDSANRREPLETWRRQVLHHTGLGFCRLADPSSEEGQRKDRIRIRIGIVPVEEDALRLVQHHGNFSKTDGSGFDESDEEVREPCDVLRG